MIERKTKTIKMSYEVESKNLLINTRQHFDYCYYTIFIMLCNVCVLLVKDINLTDILYKI